MPRVPTPNYPANKRRNSTRKPPKRPAPYRDDPAIRPLDADNLGTGGEDRGGGADLTGRDVCGHCGDDVTEAKRKAAKGSNPDGRCPGCNNPLANSRRL